jgi:DNA/RNA endonuclease YhcR with UshA esterase domain
MKIGTVNVKVSAVSLAVVTAFTLIFLIYVFLSGDYGFLVWGLPTLLLLLLIPMGLNFLSQRQYRDLIPLYEQEAKKVSAKAVNLGMLQKPVRIEGVVERVYFRYLNRPQYLIADRSGEVSVKMFTSPAEDIRTGDVVEVLGLVMKRYIFTGDAIINCVSIRKIDRSEKSS